jgi:RNA exonuclease 1
MPNIRARLGKGVPTNHDNATANEITVARAVLCSVREDAPNSGKARSHSSRSSARDESLGGGAKRTAAARTSTAAADLCGRPMPFPPVHYALTPKQMVEMDYPTPTFAGPEGGTHRDASDASERASRENGFVVPEGFVVTQPAGGGVARSPPLSMLAVDCEMCYVGTGADRRLALTRASAVGPDGSVVYDKLCAPREPITDYNTAHSGITAEQMRGVTTTLEDVQRELLELIAQETVLIGHSLENDLRRMRIMHATCVDTVALYPHPRGPPFRSKLSALTEKHLARRIQEGTHDSVADARATMELALLKFTNGPGFGEPAGAGGSLFEACAAAGVRCAAFDRRHVLDALLPSGGPPGTKTFPCVADAHVAAELAKEVRTREESVLDRATDAPGQAPGAEEAAKQGSSHRGAFFAFAHLRGYYEHLDGAAKRWAAATGRAPWVDAGGGGGGGVPGFETRAETEDERVSGVGRRQ